MYVCRENLAEKTHWEYCLPVCKACFCLDEPLHGVSFPNAPSLISKRPLQPGGVSPVSKKKQPHKKYNVTK